MFIDKILDMLNSRLDKNKSLTVQQELGYKFEASFSFNDPATIDEIQHLETTLSITLPSEYKEFIQRHNGAELFLNEEEGASYELLSLSGIKEYHGYLDYLPAGFPIEYGMDRGITNNEYLYWIEDGSRQ